MRIIKVTEEQFNQLNEVRYINAASRDQSPYGKKPYRKNWEDQYNQEPIKNNEKIRVFHGCSIDTALEICTKGTSGKVYHPRTYSYESGMNPLGIFVTVNFEKAKDFGYDSQAMCVLEFTVNSSDLESPIWNGSDSYFSQGSNPMPFNNSDERKVQKAKYDQDALNTKDYSYYDMFKKKDVTFDKSYIRNSDKPAMAMNIFDNPEHQALFMGDLNPNMIKYVWVCRNGEREYTRYSEKDFLLKFGKKKKKNNGRFAYLESKPFLPNEDITSWEDAIQKIAKHHNMTVENVTKLFNDFGVFDNPPRTSSLHLIEDVFWPKQIIQLFGKDFFNREFNRLEQDF